MSGTMKRDPFSGLFVIIAICISIYLFTFSQSLVILFPAFLTTSALALQDYYKKHKNAKGQDVEDWSYDSTITNKQAYSDIYYTVIAIAGMLATSLLVGYISYRGLNLSVQNAALFGALEGIAEEQLFRGFFQTYFVDTLKSPTVAVILSSVVFMLFHEAVYGGSDASLIYVFIGGLILGWVTWKSKSLVASVIAHVTNNILASLGLVLVTNKVIALTFMIPIAKGVLRI